jgi:hypothetical protein
MVQIVQNNLWPILSMEIVEILSFLTNFVCLVARRARARSLLHECAQKAQ